MKNDRLKEITAFANDFNKRLKLSDDELIEELNFKKLNRRNKKNSSKYFIERCITPNTKTKFFHKELFKPLLPWIPNSKIGNYFNKFEKLNDAHNLTAWEKVKLNI